MRTNTLKTAWADGHSTLGLWLALPDRNVAEALGAHPVDYLNIDMQHGLIDYADALGLLQVTRHADAVPLARVPWNEPGIIGKVLDAGAMGIIVPMVNSVAEAEQAVSACFYQPKGARSHGPVRAAAALGDGYAAEANDQIACIPMIETVQAVERIDEILAVPGIDAVYVGPADLSRTLGLPPAGDHDDASFVDALTTIVAACDRAGVIAGIHAAPPIVQKRLDQGFRMVTVTSDLLALHAGVAASLATAAAPDGDDADGGALY